MNFGQNFQTWLSSNLQPLVLAALGMLGVYFFIERKFNKIVVLIIVAVVAVGFVFATTEVKDLLVKLFKQIFN